MSIGCDANKVPAPATVADMLKPEYKGMIALNGNPKAASAGMHGVVMAALANGGSADDIAPGVEFFNQLNEAGNLLPVDPTPATITSGQTPCVIDWEYNNAAPDRGPGGQGIDWQLSVPTDAAARGRVLHPGHQQGRAASCGRPPVAGVPVHPRGPERVAEGLRPTGPAQRRWSLTAPSTRQRSAISPRRPARRSSLTQEQTTAAAEYLAANWSIELP